MNRKAPSKVWKVVPVRLDPALIRRLDRFVERQQGKGTFITRSDAVRMWIVRGLDEEEKRQ